MRTNVESIEPGWKPEGKRLFPIFGALVAAMMLATPAPAQTNAVSDAIWASANQIVQAAVAAGGGDSATALSALDTAKSLLSQAQTALPSSGLSDKLVKKLGKGIVAQDKKLVHLGSYFDNPKWTEKSAVSKLANAAKSLQKLANLAGKPLLEEVNARSAGFHKAGTVVTMAFAIPEGGCPPDDPPYLHYTETVSGVVELFTPDYETGVLLVTLGTTRGAADVKLEGCGAPPGGNTWEIYNYGAAPAPSAKFPTNLPKGNYGLTYSWSIADITCCSDPLHCTTTPGSTYGPTTYPVSFPLVNLKLFRSALETAFNAAVASVSEPGCTQHVSYSPFSDDAFTVTYTVTCTSPGCTGGATTFSFTLQKQ